MEQEQQEWQDMATLMSTWLQSNAISKEQLFWALAIVRSRAFSGPNFVVPISFSLGIFAVLQVGLCVIVCVCAIRYYVCACVCAFECSCVF